MRTPSSVTRGMLPGGLFLSMMACLCLHALQAAGAAPEGGLKLPGDVPVPADIEPADILPAAEAPPPRTQTAVESPTEVFSGPLVGAATDPQRYFVFDALAMQRNNALKDGPLVVENVTPQFTALQTNMLQSTVAPGVRLLYGDYGCDGIGWETGYLGLWNMYSRARMESPNALLQAPGALGSASTAMQNGSQGDFTGITSLQSFDVNVVFHQFDGGWNPRSQRPSQRVNWYDGGHLDWITGFRWAGLDDVGILGFTPSGAPAANTYTAHTSSNLFAGQVGVRGRMEFQEWALESWIKVGLAGTSLSQTQSFQDQLAPLDPFRPTGSSWKGGMGMIADANLSGIWRIDDTWGFRFGYNLLWFTGVALAPDQYNFSASTSPATAIDNTGSLFLSGANAGLEARW